MLFLLSVTINSQLCDLGKHNRNGFHKMVFPNNLISDKVPFRLGVLVQNTNIICIFNVSTVPHSNVGSLSADMFST